MTRMTFHISMSLGGFVTASNVRAEQPLGDGGQRLNEWASGDDERNRGLLVEVVSFVGRSSRVDAPTTSRFRGGERTPGGSCSGSGVCRHLRRA